MKFNNPDELEKLVFLLTGNSPIYFTNAGKKYTVFRVESQGKRVEIRTLNSEQDKDGKWFQVKINYSLAQFRNVKFSLRGF